MRQDESYIPVPEWPPLPAGQFASYDWWLVHLQSGHRIDVAIKAGVLVAEPLGPRGGKWLAAWSRERWHAWALDFNRRASRRWEGYHAAQVVKRLSR